MLHAAATSSSRVDGGFSATSNPPRRPLDQSGRPERDRERAPVGHCSATRSTAPLRTCSRASTGSRVLRRSLDAPDSLVAEPHDQPRFTFVHVPVAACTVGLRARRRAAHRGPPDCSTWTRSVYATSTARSAPTCLRPGDRIVAGQTLDRAVEPTVLDSPIRRSSSSSPTTAPARKSTSTSRRRLRPCRALSNFFADLHAGPARAVRRVHHAGQHLPDALNGYFGLDVPRQPDTIYAWSGPEVNLFPVTVPGTNSR